MAVIFAGVNGYLDKLDVNDVGKFEEGLLAHMRTDGKEVLDTIREEKALSDETTGKLTAAIDDYRQILRLSVARTSSNGRITDAFT